MLSLSNGSGAQRNTTNAWENCTYSLGQETVPKDLYSVSRTRRKQLIIILSVVTDPLVHLSTSETKVN